MICVAFAAQVAAVVDWDPETEAQVWPEARRRRLLSLVARPKPLADGGAGGGDDGGRGDEDDTDGGGGQLSDSEESTTVCPGGLDSFLLGALGLWAGRGRALGPGAREPGAGSQPGPPSR